MVWTINWHKKAAKEFLKIDFLQQKKIKDFIENKLIKDPLSYGSYLVGDKNGLIRYRIGNNRIICEINNLDLTILIINVGHRKDIYNK